MKGWTLNVLGILVLGLAFTSWGHLVKIFGLGKHFWFWPKFWVGAQILCWGQIFVFGQTFCVLAKILGLGQMVVCGRNFLVVAKILGWGENFVFGWKSCVGPIILGFWVWDLGFEVCMLLLGSPLTFGASLVFLVAFLVAQNSCFGITWHGLAWYGVVLENPWAMPNIFCFHV